MRRNFFRQYRPRLQPTLVALIVAIAIAYGGNHLLAEVSPIVLLSNHGSVEMSIGQVFGYISYLIAYCFRVALAHRPFPDIVGFAMGTPFYVLHILSQYELLRPFTVDLIAIVAASVFGSAASYWMALRRMPYREHLRQLGGRILCRNHDANRRAARALRAERRATGVGLELAPGVRISRERESRHLLISGASGTGKTIIIWHLLAQILRRRDRAILHDAKGDLTERLPTEEFVLLAPHDKRSAIWDIAADVEHAQSAREFSAGFIQESRDPMWSLAAREIMTGVLIHLMTTRHRDWGWDDLSTELFAPPSRLRDILERHYPPARDYIALEKDGQPTKTTSSFLATLRPSIAATVLPLAAAWPSNSKKTRISLKQWMLNDGTKDRTIVLQRAAHLPELSTAWISAIVQVAASVVASPLLADDAKRRIFFVLDEFGQLHLPGFHQVLEKGRSRGACAILAVQDIAQIEVSYGEPTMRTWLATIGTKVLGRADASPSVPWLCETLIGKRDVSWVDVSQSGSNWDGTSTTNRAIRRETLPVVTPDFFERELGRRELFLRAEIRALVLGIGGVVYRLRWPIIPLAPRRPVTTLADWLKSPSANNRENAV